MIGSFVNKTSRDSKSVLRQYLLLLGFFLGSAIEVVPSGPLVSALEIKDTGLSSLVVTNSSLLIKTVKLKELVISGSLGKSLNTFSLIKSKRKKTTRKNSENVSVRVFQKLVRSPSIGRQSIASKSNLQQQ